MLFDGQPGEKRRNLRCAELPRMPPVMEHDEAPDPMDVGILGPPAVVPRPNLGAHLLEKTRRRHGNPLATTMPSSSGTDQSESGPAATGDAIPVLTGLKGASPRSAPSGFGP